MRKLSILLLFIVLGLVACSNEEQVRPEDRLQQYVDYWNEQDFEQMYEMVQDVEKDQFVERYQKLYGDIELSNLSVSFEEPEAAEDEEEVDIDEIESATFPLSVNMETVAGPISFTKDIAMVKVTETVDDKEQIDWKVNWNPGFIFPELENGSQLDINTTQPTRGQIFDRNNNGLAVNQDVYEFAVVPDRFEDEESEKKAIAEALDIEIAAIEKALSADWVRQDVLVPLKVVPSLDKNGYQEAVDSIPGLTYSTQTGRTYPLGEAAAHLVGYIAPITAEKLEEAEPGVYTESSLVGNRGLEELFEERLRGEAGVQLTAVKEEQEPVIIAEKAVQNGEDITLTIDGTVQTQLFDSLEGEAGTAAAVDPTTGETLALVSSPSFDPHPFLYGLSNDQWTEWNEDPQQPLLNRFAATFAPGSSFKPITSAIGLENGSIDPNEGLSINGLTWQKEGWGNYEVTRVSESSGPVDLRDALVHSDNIYFAMQAVNMGEEAFLNGLKNFGLADKFPFTYPIESGTISSDGTLSEEVLLADTSYGQGQLELSALQLATSYSVLLNQGNLVQPILLSDEEKGQNWKEGILSEDNAAIIRDALRAVVTDGSGQTANVDNVAVSGKTGTAELKQSLDEENGAENGWFVGYPEDGSVIISMMIENIEGRDHGSGYVAEKVGKVLSSMN
ncbi:penicillin-binding transpeptidase domain-containing protein [Gracilibacillus caseinilyticus]|uniref:serine-type D-Ala-D-Ala carboxypeptidase n=1 Tax=Gracilibacillus caseinilyticus TaxID=2932256 RepID=A0ABY4EV82_9BACI|nr:penicillin-binding transpeptidase domain-containing protein [Gracilibacillus caseinilyticus]UOQ48323.1 penicillin-binding transpeptidase domain-containing protein [Gracilibacillus caseinilyticus]